MKIREGRPGDLGWMFHRQAVVYAEEFRYNSLFERFVAHTLPPFLDHFEWQWDRLFIAEEDGRIQGFIAIQHDSGRPGWAKLRWFLVEKEARGAGLGQQLFDLALGFAQGAGYGGIHLHTVSDLHAARRLYERAGFQMVKEEPKPCAWAPWAHEQEWELSFAAQHGPSET
jgi:GNAT superfamily N-acetyltransferase